MPRKRINESAPLTGAEKAQRYRSKQRKNMTIDQEDRAVKKLWRELTNILDTMPEGQLYALAPIMRYMNYSKKIHDEILTKEMANYLSESMKGLDLSSFPSAVYNRDDDENAEMLNDEGGGAAHDKRLKLERFLSI